MSASCPSAKTPAWSTIALFFNAKKGNLCCAMKPAITMLVGLFLLVVLFAAEFYIAAIVFLLGCLTLILILAGTLISPQSRVYSLAIPAAEPGSFLPEWPCLEGTRIDPHQYQRFQFHIEARGFGLLAVIGIGALYVMKLVIEKHGNPFRPYHEVAATGDYILFFVLAFVSMVPVAIAGSWFLERIRLVQSKTTIGSFDPLTGGYAFCDHHGSRFGGTRKPTQRKPEDNICVVFYAPRNSAANTSSSGLLFHRLRLQPLSPMD